MNSVRPAAVLIGPPGSGKSTVGQLLADRLGVGFRDTDADVEATAGKPISDIFIEDGEARFRELEAAAVRAALAGHDGVLSLGGGAVLDPGTQELLTADSPSDSPSDTASHSAAHTAAHTVVYLQVALDQAVKRVGLAGARPLLVLNPRSRLRALMEERRPVYERLATLTVHTDDRDPEEIAEEIASALAAGSRP